MANGSCVSRDPGRANEAHPLAVAGAVTTGAVVGALASPITVPMAVIAGSHRREESEALAARLDPIYFERAARIRSRDPIIDAAKILESGLVAFMPSVPNGAFYPGLAVESSYPEKHGIPSRDANLRIIEATPLLRDVMILAANDPSHPTGEKATLYFNDVYRAFLKAGADYKTVFNQAMLRGSKEKRPNKAPEPTPMSVTPPAAQESRQP